MFCFGLFGLVWFGFSFLSCFILFCTLLLILYISLLILLLIPFLFVSLLFCFLVISCFYFILVFFCIVCFVFSRKRQRKRTNVYGDKRSKGFVFAPLLPACVSLSKSLCMSVYGKHALRFRFMCKVNKGLPSYGCKVNIVCENSNKQPPTRAYSILHCCETVPKFFPAAFKHRHHRRSMCRFVEPNTAVLRAVARGFLASAEAVAAGGETSSAGGAVRKLISVLGCASCFRFRCFSCRMLHGMAVVWCARVLFVFFRVWAGSHDKFWFAV